MGQDARRMVLPSLARLSIERAAPTAAPSDAPTDAPAPLATPSAEDVLVDLARQERLAGDAAQVAVLEVLSLIRSGAQEVPMHVVGEQIARKKAARAALDAFMDAAIGGVARVLVTGPDDPRKVDDAAVSLKWLLYMWDRYADGPSRELLRDSFHESAQEKGLYAVLVDLLGQVRTNSLELHKHCVFLVATMTGNLWGIFTSVRSARVDSEIHLLARTALAKASNGRIGSHLLATLTNDALMELTVVYALTALHDLTFSRFRPENRPPDGSTTEPMTSTAAALAADKNIEVLFKMLADHTESVTIRNAAFWVLSNILYYNNGQMEPSPLLEQILGPEGYDCVKTITKVFNIVTQPNTTTWLQLDNALTFLERFLFALKRANEEVLNHAFERLRSHETAFVPTMLAYWKGTPLLTSAQSQQIAQIFSRFGQLDEGYKKSQKWQRALIDNGVYDYLETALKELDASRQLNFQPVTAYIDLLKYTLLPIPELWVRAKGGGLLDWMIDAATAEAPHFGERAMKNQFTLHFVLSQIAAKDGGIAEWLLSNNGEGARRDRLLHCWAPKQYQSSIVAHGYASGFRALLCHGVAFDLVTTRNAQRVSGASVYTLPEGSEQWDWEGVERVLRDPNIIELAAVQGPAPSTGAAILMTLHILDVLNEDPQATTFEGPEGEKPEDKLVRRNTKWANLLHQFQTLHEGNGQLKEQLNKLINLVTELLQHPGPSNSAYILSQRQSEVWKAQEAQKAQEASEQPTKRPRITTTDAVYARFLDLAQLRFRN